MRLHVIISLGALALMLLFLSPITTSDPFSSCRELPADERPWCLQNRIETPARAGDFESAFARLAYAYESDQNFARDCHGSAHALGSVAYEQFKNGARVNPTKLSSYCGYGFYHGLMEKVLLNTGGTTEAVLFCKDVGMELRDSAPDAEGACYHGIGHGVVDGSDPRVWGDPSALVEAGITLCEGVVGGLLDEPPLRGPLYRCVSGAYNSLEILSQNSKHKLQALANNPFGFCSTQRKEYHEACFTNMLPAMLRLRSENFSAIVGDIASVSILTNKERSGLVTDLFHERIRLFGADDLATQREGVTLCRSLPEVFSLPCIEGLAGGELKYGEPTKEYAGLLALCGGDLSVREREVCYRYGLSRLGNLYSREKKEGICRDLPQDVQSYCYPRYAK